MGLTPINKIIPLSMVDGPGCRTTIFVQGCNIACAYCHNPETQNICCHCGICVPECPEGALTILDGKVIWDEKMCTSCDRCITICPYYASPKIKMMDAKEVFEQVSKNMPFIQGLTVSGGECTLYPDFLKELFSLAKEVGLTCLMDTNGMVDLSLNPELIDVCDGVMLDVKSWDKMVYQQLTKAESNDNMKKNLRYLSDSNKLEEIRIVCIPGEVDGQDILRGIKSTIGEKVKTTKLKLIKFRHYGVKGRLANTKSPGDVHMQELFEIATGLGFKKVQII